MATTLATLVIIATTLVALFLFVWATLYYVPLILNGDDHAEETHVEAGRAS